MPHLRTAHRGRLPALLLAPLDLARWLSGAYAIPVEVESEDGGEAAAPSASLPPEGTDRQK